jgi:hypothetical protein
MSNYYFLESFDYSKNKPEKVLDKTVNNKVFKDKFFVRGDPSEDVPGYHKMSQEKCQMIDNETNLLTPGIQTNDKIQVVLKEELDPYNYNINYKDGLKKYQTQKTDYYYNNKNVGPGRGFGNLNISNDIRNGDASRNDTKENNEKQEGQQMFDYTFQYLNKNFQDPNHIVMSIPRGGVQTRKQKQLSVDTMRTFDSKDQCEHPELNQIIKFNY